MSNSICYSSCCCSKEMFCTIWKNNMDCAPAQSIQKYHRLLAEGFYDNGYDVNMISFLPLPESETKRYKNGKREEVGGVKFYYLPFLKFKLFKYPSVAYYSYNETRKLMKQGSAFAIGDALNSAVTLGCLAAAKKERKPFISIVTDLPSMFEGYSRSLKFHISEYIMKKSDGFIFLTEEMNQVANKKGKPYIILEGHVDGRDIQNKNKVIKNRKFVVMYAGSLAKQYGIDYLIDGFIKAQISNSELHLYGNGDYAEEAILLSRKYKNIKYYGECINEEVVRAEQEATLLVNPRPTNEEYTKYSFPSKNMEYMLSGTPVLTTNLPGMPREYLEYIYLLKTENSEGVADMLKKISMISREELNDKGNRGRKFVLNEKSNKIQAKRIIEELVGRCFV